MTDIYTAVIDKILEPFNRGDVTDTFLFPERAKEAKQAILAILAQEVNRVIGEDENEGIYTDGEPDRDYDAYTRNQLRAEQRRKAGLV